MARHFCFRSAAFALALLAATLPLARPSAAQAPAAAAPPVQRVLLRVKVDAAGRIQASTPLDASNPPALIKAGEEIARKLSFTPARKDGRAVPSETSLMLTLAFVPRAGGAYGISLAGAQNGPSITELGKQGGSFGAERSGRVSVSVDLLADGSTNMKSFQGASGADERLADSARKLLAGTRFLLDTVDGISIPARITFDIDFGSGEPPSVTPVSKIEGISFARIEYRKP